MGKQLRWGVLATCGFLCAGLLACDSADNRTASGEGAIPKADPITDPAAGPLVGSEDDVQRAAKLRRPGADEAALVNKTASTPEMLVAPGLQDREYIGPLSDAFRRIDPTEDGWQSEVFSEAATEALTVLGHALERSDGALVRLSDGPDWGRIVAQLTDDFATMPWQPQQLVEAFRDETLTVRRSAGEGTELVLLEGADGLTQQARRFVDRFQAGRADHVKLKLFQVNREQSQVSSQVLFQASGRTEVGTLEINATWRIEWRVDGEQPRMQRLIVESYEESLYQGSGKFMYEDCTESVMGATDAYRSQLAYPTDYWRSRLPRNLGLDVVANHGLALGDVNGDGLDDMYLCQQGGLPNRLLLQNSDGTLRDASPGSGADWLDYCPAALLIDMDNDGDRDLVVAHEFAIAFMSNNGTGRFELREVVDRSSQTYSITAADYDWDGDLDVYCCGYNPASGDVRRGAMGEPMPFHDANNGGSNALLQNDGGWRFSDVTASVGLDQNNSRYSFAAAWEDFDNDGDLDLYVSNDYGRNNLYRNDAAVIRPGASKSKPTFVDVAGELGVEDISAGMSVAWGDYDRDGWMDLYVSNMFSAAGNRITYQRQFKADVGDEVRRQFQRIAHGNTMFHNVSGNRFEDVTDAANVWLGRWAWGSRFVDINGDGWEDLVVANGFITTENTGDL